MKRRLGITTVTLMFSRFIVWIARTTKSKFKRAVWNGSLSTFVYSLWKCRDDAYWKLYVLQPHAMIDILKRTVKRKLEQSSLRRYQGKIILGF